MVHQCGNCGAALELLVERAVRCTFCDSPNGPLPRRADAPVPVQVVHIHRGPRTDGARSKCPNCHRTLVAVQADGVTLEGCGGCGGIWVGNASAQAILERPEPSLGELARRAAAAATVRRRSGADRPCPECGVLLGTVRRRHLELDVCAAHGTWFDAYELVTLVEALRAERRGAARQGGAAGVDLQQQATCVQCQARDALARMNVSDAGLCCEACWREQVQGLLRAAEAQRPGRALAGAAITAQEAGEVGGSLMGGLAFAMVGIVAAGAARPGD